MSDPVNAFRQAAILTVSDRVYRRERGDAGGEQLAGYLVSKGFSILRRSVVPDEVSRISAALTEFSARDVPFVVTTGGTGFGPRDVTPEATRLAIEREAPGLAEEMRRKGAQESPFASLSRGVAGIRGRTLILNLPGRPAGAVASLDAVIEIIPHALEVLRRPFFDHG